MLRFSFLALVEFVSIAIIAQNHPESNLGKQKICFCSEKEPRFPGGERAMAKFIQANLVYPQKAAEANISGTVYVQFIVTSSGEILKIKILEGVHELLDNAAMDVIAKMPNWIPARQNCKKVWVNYTLPIQFLLDNEDRK